MSAQQLALDLKHPVNLNAIGHQTMAAIDAAAARFWQSESADNFIAAEAATADQKAAEAHYTKARELRGITPNHSEQQTARCAA